MNTTYINIEKKNGKVQYLTEVLPEIPTNTILYKKLLLSDKKFAKA